MSIISSPTVCNATSTTGTNAHATLELIKHKLTDAEYKSIAEQLVLVQHQEEEENKHYKITYQISQSYIEKMFLDADEGSVERLITLESNHSSIVQLVKNIGAHPACLDNYVQYSETLLNGLRESKIQHQFVDLIQSHLKKFGFSSWSNKDHARWGYGGRKGDAVPWMGTHSSDLMTKVMIVKCDEYNT